MGLDISAYARLEPAPDAALDEDGNPVEWDKYLLIREEHLFLSTKYRTGRADDLSAGVFAIGETFTFRAGSYGGYNHWRDWLAKIAGHGCAKNVWQNPDTPGLCVELIDFSDGEGFIGPTVAAKLARDFDTLAPSVGEKDGYYAERFEDWRKAFHLAADGGAVEFH